MWSRPTGKVLPGTHLLCWLHDVFDPAFFLAASSLVSLPSSILSYPRPKELLFSLIYGIHNILWGVTRHPVILPVEGWISFCQQVSIAKSILVVSRNPCPLPSLSAGNMLGQNLCRSTVYWHSLWAHMFIVLGHVFYGWHCFLDVLHNHCLLESSHFLYYTKAEP